ncbi:hypothetical protein M5Z42_10580, partial [Neisseria meningitidis]|nr:hypothetical protein [Neisseria meningitidis]
KTGHQSQKSGFFSPFFAYFLKNKDKKKCSPLFSALIFLITSKDWTCPPQGGGFKPKEKNIETGNFPKIKKFHPFRGTINLPPPPPPPAK